MTDCPWGRIHRQPRVVAGEIHVWRIPLEYNDTAYSLLSADERARARRLLSATKRDRFIAGRSALRRLLGAYTGSPAQSLRFSYGPYGKPALPGAGLVFNFSHSEKLALLAVSGDRDVGIDIEYRERNIRIAPLARHILTPPEAAAFSRVPAAQQAADLLATWTRKEAYIKALGEGLARPLNSFSVALPAPGEPARLELPDSNAERRSWTFLPLAPHPDYLAALAAPGSDWVPRCFAWSPDGP